MKKWIILIIGFLLTFGLAGCSREIPSYTNEEAFAKMNEAIQNYLDAESMYAEYSASYVSDNYNNTEFISVKMKKMSSVDLIGLVNMSITDSGSSFTERIDYADTYVYTAKTADGDTTYVKVQNIYMTFQNMYQLFIKTQIDIDDTRYAQTTADQDYLTLTFELGSSKVESTVFVNANLDTVSYATITITCTHDAKLVSLIVDYNATYSNVTGKESYVVSFIKIDQYFVMNQLSSIQKDRYEDQTVV